MSFLLDYYHMSYDIVMSEDLTLEELLLLSAHKTTWENYVGLKEKAYQQELEKKNKK